jgi:hypothetical protein
MEYFKPNYLGFFDQKFADETYRCTKVEKERMKNIVKNIIFDNETGE